MLYGIIVQNTKKEKKKKKSTRSCANSYRHSNLVSIDKLYIETGWEPLKSRRRKHKLTLFYEMINNLASHYLSSLLPSQVGNVSRYKLINQEKYQTIDYKSRLYFNSFLPPTACEWNSLESSVCSSLSFNC